MKHVPGVYFPYSKTNWLHYSTWNQKLKPFIFSTPLPEKKFTSAAAWVLTSNLGFVHIRKIQKIHLSQFSLKSSKLYLYPVCYRHVWTNRGHLTRPWSRLFCRAVTFGLRRSMDFGSLKSQIKTQLLNKEQYFHPYLNIRSEVCNLIILQLKLWNARTFSPDFSSFPNGSNTHTFSYLLSVSRSSKEMWSLTCCM